MPIHLVRKIFSAYCGTKCQSFWELHRVPKTCRILRKFRAERKIDNFFNPKTSLHIFYVHIVYYTIQTLLYPSSNHLKIHMTIVQVFYKIIKNTNALMLESNKTIVVMPNLLIIIFPLPTKHGIPCCVKTTQEVGTFANEILRYLISWKQKLNLMFQLHLEKSKHSILWVNTLTFSQ